jgi:hypothetical protein
VIAGAVCWAGVPSAVPPWVGVGVGMGLAAYAEGFVDRPPSSRPFAPFLGVVPAVMLMLVGVPAVVGAVWLGIHQGDLVAAAVTVGVVGMVVMGGAVWWAWRWARRGRSGPSVG